MKNLTDHLHLEYFLILYNYLSLKLKFNESISVTYITNPAMTTYTGHLRYSRAMSTVFLQLDIGAYCNLCA